MEFDPLQAFLPKQRKYERESTSGRTGYRCAQPVLRKTPRGEFLVSCYSRCEFCLNGRKQDVVGRVIAQAVTSTSTVFVTLTYKDGNIGAQKMIKADWDRCINRLRMHLKRKFGTTIKVFFAFERGENMTQRVHIHAILMFHGPHDIVIPKDPKARSWVKWWKFGHVNLSDVSADTSELSRRVRYVASYLFKQNHRGEDAPFGWSTAGLGEKYLADLGREHAEKGLMPQGWYHLPGLIFTRGKYKGQHQKFFLRGAGARIFATAYRERFEELHPGEIAPAIPWMLQADDQSIDAAIAGRVRIPEMKWKPHAPVWKSHDCTAAKAVTIGDMFAGLVRLDADGLASWHPKGGGQSIDLANERDVDSVLFDASIEQRRMIGAWIDEIRGVGWVDPVQRQRDRVAVAAAIKSRDIGSRLGDVINSVGVVIDPGLDDRQPMDRDVLAARLRDP